MSADTLRAMGTTIELDTDAISPDSLKAAFSAAVDALLSRADRKLVALNWNSLEVALTPISDSDTLLVLRAGVAP